MSQPHIWILEVAVIREIEQLFSAQLRQPAKSEGT